MDADGQHAPEDIPRFLEQTKNSDADIIVGTRMRNPGSMPFDRYWTNRFTSWVISGLCRQSIPDSQCGFRLYPLPETLNLEAKTRRFQYEVEILALAAWNGLQIIEAPVDVFYQPPEKRVSHFKPGLDFLRNTKTFARLILARALIPHRLRVRKNLKP